MVRLEKRATGHATTLGAASGAVAGLVAITPSAGFVNSIGAIAGLVAGGGAALLGKQALGVLVTIGWAFALTYAIAQAVQRTIGLRVSAEHEQAGLDQSIHAENAYEHGSLTGR